MFNRNRRDILRIEAELDHLRVEHSTRLDRINRHVTALRMLAGPEVSEPEPVRTRGHLRLISGGAQR